MRKILNETDLTLGTCYYPEHWDPALWEADLGRMLENGIETVRIAEFAWNKVEPEEGVFTFQFFDAFLDTAHKCGMKVIFCTPTATPPAWLTEKYPEVLNGDIEGHLFYHGGRRHYNYNSPKYQELTRIIVEQFASHYGPHPAVIGWQIDNELNCEVDVFYSESDTLAFRRFLQDKYGTLKALNNAWGTDFWNQTYSSWDQVYVPRRTVPENNCTNLHRMLDYIRFVSDSARRFALMQADILRKYLKEDDFITTNGIFSNLDNHELARESLDFMAYDSYPSFSYGVDSYRSDDPLKDRWWSKNLSEVRSISPIFAIMEQQSGAGGWNTWLGAPTPKPGQITLWTMQSIAHGADYVSYFRWRTCTMGTEIYWHGILDYSGRDNERLREIRRIHEKLASMQEIAGSLYHADTAVLKDYDNIWDAKVDVWHKKVESISQDGIFQAAQLTHTPLDYIYFNNVTSAGQLLKYKVIFYPHASILTRERITILEEYVSQGGTLIMGCRTGYKDLTGKCIMDPLPGLAAPVTGTDIPEYTLAAPDEAPIYIKWEDPQDGDTLLEAAAFNDILQPSSDTAKVLGQYQNSWYAGRPGLVRNQYGKGCAYYFGGAFTPETARIFLQKTGAAEPLAHLLQLPECCEAAVREKHGIQYLFVLNYSSQPASVTLTLPLEELSSRKTLCGIQELPPYGCLVLKNSSPAAAF